MTSGIIASMKHWMFIGTAILLAAVAVFRSRVSKMSAVPPPSTAPGIRIDRLPVSYRPTTTRPATTRGVRMSVLQGTTLAPATATSTPR